jgi:hypothetical protein
MLVELVFSVHGLPPLDIVRHQALWFLAKLKLVPFSWTDLDFLPLESVLSSLKESTCSSDVILRAD